MNEARKQDFILITLLGVAHGLSHYFHLIIPPLFPWIMPEFGTSFAQMGAVMTVFFICSSLGQATSGVLVRTRNGLHGQEDIDVAPDKALCHILPEFQILILGENR